MVQSPASRISFFYCVGNFEHHVKDFNSKIISLENFNPSRQNPTQQIIVIFTNYVFAILQFAEAVKRETNQFEFTLKSRVYYVQ